MTLEETIATYKMRASLEEAMGDISNAEEHKQVAEWLRELKKWRKVRNRLSQNRITTSMYGDVVYGDVVMWNDIKRVIEEVQDDGSSCKSDDI